MSTSPNGRVDFSKTPSSIPLPNLIQVQRASYEDFLQMDLLPEERGSNGLESVLQSIFPFTDFRETCELQFVKYEIGNWTCRCGRLDGLHHLRLTCEHCSTVFKAADPHEEEVVCPHCGKANRNRIQTCGVCGTAVGLRLPFSDDECRERSMTYAVPVRLTFRLVTFDTEEDGTRQVRDVKEEELYFGELPLMTDTGTFIINGTERVIVSQLHRSPGVFFTLEGPNHYLAKVVPYRGSWIEFEYDTKQVLWVRIDRKRRLPGTVFLRALSPELEINSQILRAFYTVFDVRLDPKQQTAATLLLDHRLLDIEAERQKAMRFRKIAEPHLVAGLTLNDSMRKRLDKATLEKPARVAVERAELIGAIIVDDLVDKETGEVIAAANTRVTDDVLALAEEAGIDALSLAFPDWDPVGEILHQTLEKDSTVSQMEARMEIYRRQRPGDPPDRRVGDDPVQRSLLRRAALRPVAGGTLQVQRQAVPQEGVGPPHPGRGRLPASGPLPAAPAPRPRPGGRHRLPGQPPGPHGGRAAGEPVPHRSGAHGARHQGEDVDPPRHRLGHAP